MAVRRSPGPRARTIAVAALVAFVVLVSVGCRLSSRPVEAGFYFEPVSFTSQALGGSLEPRHLEAIEATARAELSRAFQGLGLVLSDRRDARYRVAVVQEIRDPRLQRAMFVAGESRAVRGFGGSGAVNFSLLASAALSCASRETSHEERLAAIGRGIGRAAAHELAHQLLPSAPIHDSTDLRSYEYRAASRCEQYFGEMRWSLAGPLLRTRLGPAD